MKTIDLSPSSSIKLLLYFLLSIFLASFFYHYSSWYYSYCHCQFNRFIDKVYSIEDLEQAIINPYFYNGYKVSYLYFTLFKILFPIQLFLYLTANVLDSLIKGFSFSFSDLLFHESLILLITLLVFWAGTWVFN